MSAEPETAAACNIHRYSVPTLLNPVAHFEIRLYGNDSIFQPASYRIRLQDRD